ncbi:WD40 repeat domain-containing protein [Streptomyces sp. NPDC020422]|uniref:WD40 repeat domain-containing protein n=1 Tax=Streptomyces sp. NPDC020422 TaxID=3365074 RepID=UPI0037A7A79E
MPSVRAERPGASALLGWLTDPEAPRLCLVTEAPGLLDWLAAHGPRAAGRRRAARALVPLAGQSALGTAWAVAGRLGAVATSPADLVRVLATTETGRTSRTVLLLPGLDAAAEPVRIAELLRDLATLGRVRVVVEARPGSPEHAVLATAPAAVVDGEQGTEPGPAAVEPGLPDLSDPLAVCAADPVAVTTGYVRDAADQHGGLRPAWLRAGQALCTARTPADRALALLAALGDGADPRLRPALEEAAATAPWRLRWSRVAGDVAPPWPGPVAALAVQGGTLLAADLGGAVRLLGAADARPHGQLDHPVTGRVTALAPAPDGTVLLLDERGRLHTVRGREPRPPYLQRLTEAVAATLTRHPGTALAAISGSVVVGDRLGSVHAFGLTGLHQAALHSGRVTAVGAVESETPFVCSGGADGTVRRWTPGREPDPAPLAERPSPVVSLHAAETPYGPFVAVAWADGTAELHQTETGERRSFRPGPPLRAVAVTPDGALVLGLDEALVRLDRRTG